MTETKTACTHVWPAPILAGLRFDGAILVGFRCAVCGTPAWGKGGREYSPLNLPWPRVYLVTN